MRHIVSDTSCMIDIGKSSLVRTMLQLPYAFVMPDVLFEDELLDFGPVHKRDLLTLGLQVLELDGEGTTRAYGHFAQYRRLTLNDCFALALAEQIENCILLTGDGTLRRTAAVRDIEVHGILWVIDELERTHLATPQQLYEALRLFEEDDLVFLPQAEIRKRIRHFQRRLR